MADEQQSETIAFLNAICAQAGDATAPAATHISRIFFAGDTVFKLKRAVRTPYLDYATPDLRLAACEQELKLNRRTAPSLYRAVHRITREPQGLAFDGPGALNDAVVEMQRFDETCLFDHMAQAGTLTLAHMEALAKQIAALHAGADISTTYGGAAGVTSVLDLNEAALAQTFLANETGAADVLRAMRSTASKHASLLDARRARGKVRRCHGDLTLRNICLINGVPTPFDCLEFDEALATIDVLYDIAFPLMDLWHKGQSDLANTLFNRYLDHTDEVDGLPLAPLFIAMRAIVRAHITATMAHEANADARVELEKEARIYFQLARDAMRDATPRLIGVGGLSGSGKSTVAATLAPRLAPLPGARILSSDRVRKRLLGMDALQPLPKEAYVPEVSERVYACVREEAGRCLDAGWCVIADAVFDRVQDRSALADVAKTRSTNFNGYWLEAAPDVLTARVAARTNDPSDADVSVLRAQIKRYNQQASNMDWTPLDARKAADASAHDIIDDLAKH